MEIAGLVSTETLFELDLEHPATGAPLGIKINELPMTPSKLWALIRKARES